MKYGTKVRVTSGFYKKQKGTIKAMKDGFIGILAGVRIYGPKEYSIELTDGFITEFISESDLEIIN